MTTQTVFQFKVVLKGVKPEVWRRIQMPRDVTFHQLSMAIVDAMGWNSNNTDETLNLSRPL